mmetsp:Transcript_25414/g.58809  ORF Transcript_25414/g.58809 Transcript_25414/m.58809 type:complete len:89 (+) Transcript_25414:165-431(+)
MHCTLCVLTPPPPSFLISSLGMTVFDYYGAALCVCAVIVASEHTVPAVAWCLLCLLLGSSFCCLYMAYRLASKGTLALGSRSEGNQYE